MKKIPLAIVVIALGIGTGFSALADTGDTSATAVATWSATAKKNTESMLVVTPIGSLSFDYASGINSFNSQKGLFDVTIRNGDATSKSFNLKAQVESSKLSSLTDGSALDVGVYWNGEPIKQDTPTLLFDTKAGSQAQGGGLSVLKNVYNTAEGGSAQESFLFKIDDATDPAQGDQVITDFSKLNDGLWVGDVKVGFTATWSKTA